MRASMKRSRITMPNQEYQTSQRKIWNTRSSSARKIFSKEEWNRFYVSYLFNNSMKTPRKKSYNKQENTRDLRPGHFETKRKNNKWPSEKIVNDCKLTYFRRTNEWFLSWVHEQKWYERETHERFAAIDPGVRIPFVMYSPTMGVCEIGRTILRGW